MVSPQRMIVPLSLIVGLIASFTEMACAEEHKHDTHIAVSSHSASQNGKRWETDEPLRRGMEGIRQEMESALHHIHGSSFSGEQYRSLAKKVQNHVEEMIKTCKLPPEADARLHGVLAEMMAGSGTMEMKENPISGLHQILQALNVYGHAFDHPGWKPLAHAP